MKPALMFYAQSAAECKNRAGDAFADLRDAAKRIDGANE